MGILLYNAYKNAEIQFRDSVKFSLICGFSFSASFIGFLWHIFFPLWWYTGGVIHMLTVSSVVARGNVILAPDCGSESFCSMFGQVDCKAGLSVFMRLISAIIRGIILFHWLLLSYFSHLDSGTGRSAHAGAVVQ